MGMIPSLCGTDISTAVFLNILLFLNILPSEPLFLEGGCALNFWKKSCAPAGRALKILQLGQRQV